MEKGIFKKDEMTELSFGTWQSEDGRIKLRIEREPTDSNSYQRKRVSLIIEDSIILDKKIKNFHWHNENYRPVGLPYYLKNIGLSTLIFGEDYSNETILKKVKWYSSKSLNRIQEVIDEAKNPDGEFFSRFAEDMYATGETQCEYCAYNIDIDDDISLLIDFIEFSLKDVSVVNKRFRNDILSILNDKN